MLNKVIEIAKILKMTPQNLYMHYFPKHSTNKLTEKKKIFSYVIDVGVYCYKNKITKEELKLLVDLIREHKKYIKDKI